ncbi:CPBP family intramembrane glutamic endopeptidase [Plantactinospora endophytica]|uniref:CAAX prenyl protease 2/Lysostaphin resistance protein A-like domain-containing protein n=1 Tax=Plantactinospora endophytica TaxID=673535 RepID=A0ABQ4DWE4_9ACTN|nr:type II CAAX endopeptidase family protein [Plantactinospora endophytica]GIG86773.1 hypothetical protein Pen02_17090 [Plantactinospora endophytica]
MTTAPAPGTPYHRLARTDRHRWWRPVLGTLLILGGTLVVVCLLTGVGMSIAALAGRPTDPDGLPTLGALGELVLTLAGVAAALPFVLLAVRWVQARPTGTVSSVLGRLRWRWLGWCALVAVPTVLLLIGGSFGLLTLTGSDEGTDVGAGWPGWIGFLGALALLLLLVPLQAAAEEYVFRGWLLQAVGAFLRTPWPAIALQAVLFALAHGWGTRWGFVDLAIVAGLMAWLTIRTGGLEAAIALHVVNNVIALGGAAALGQLGAEETAADAPWEMFVVSMLVHSAYTVVVLRLARRRGLSTTTPEPLTVEPVGYLPVVPVGQPVAVPVGYPAAGVGHPVDAAVGYPAGGVVGYPVGIGQPDPALAYPAGTPGHPIPAPGNPSVAAPTPDAPASAVEVPTATAPGQPPGAGETPVGPAD